MFRTLPIFALMVVEEPVPHLDVEIAGAGAFVHFPCLSFLIVIIGVMLRILMVHMRVALTSFRVFLARFSLSKELNIGGVILALQAYSGIHIGIDNMNVLRRSCCSSLS